MSAGDKYLAAAYVVVFGVVLVYLLIIALKLGRLEREITELTGIARRRTSQESQESRPRQEANVG